jgi:hypothetical protein
MLANLAASSRAFLVYPRGISSTRLSQPSRILFLMVAYACCAISIAHARSDVLTAAAHLLVTVVAAIRCISSLATQTEMNFRFTALRRQAATPQRRSTASSESSFGPLKLDCPMSTYPSPYSEMRSSLAVASNQECERGSQICNAGHRGSGLFSVCLSELSARQTW